MNSKHVDTDTPVTLRPPSGVLAAAQDRLTERSIGMRAFFSACLAALVNNPDGFLQGLEGYWPTPKRRGRPPTLIYALRIAEDGRPWHGDLDAAGDFETGFIDFEPSVRNAFSGHRLEVRYGRVPDDGLHPAMQAYTTVNGRRLRPTAKLQKLLFAQTDADAVDVRPESRD